MSKPVRLGKPASFARPHHLRSIGRSPSRPASCRRTSRLTMNWTVPDSGLPGTLSLFPHIDIPRVCARLRSRANCPRFYTETFSHHRARKLGPSLSRRKPAVLTNRMEGTRQDRDHDHEPVPVPARNFIIADKISVGEDSVAICSAALRRYPSETYTLLRFAQRSGYISAAVVSNRSPPCHVLLW